MKPAGDPRVPSFPCRAFLGVVALVVLVFASSVLAVNATFVHDDALISLRYCHNLLHGNGLVWNPGERVEGYTNFLLIVLTSALGALGIDLVVAVRAVNGAAFVALVGYVAVFARTRTAAALRADETDAAPNPDRLALFTAVPVVLVASSVPLLVWTLGGLEAPLFALLLTVGAGKIMDFLDARPGKFALQKAGVMFGLAALTRPDGAVFPAVATLFLALHGPWRQRLRPLVVFASSFALIVAPHELFRIIYYGDWLPNTFYAKFGGPMPIRVAQGLSYIGEFIRLPPYLLPLSLVLAVAFLRRKHPRRGFAFLLLAVVAYTAFVIRVGGDYMQAFRLVAPLVPLCALLVHAEALQLWARSAVRAAYGACALAVVLLALQVRAPIVFPTDDAAFVGRIVADHIRQKWPKGSLIALNCVGATPFYAPDNQYIDMLGLVDRHIAHRRVGRWQLWRQSIPGHMRGDGAYVLKRHPDYILVGPSEGRLVDDPWFLSDLELARLPELRANYAPHTAVLDVHEMPGIENYAATLSGKLTITYYQRIARPQGAQKLL